MPDRSPSSGPSTGHAPDRRQDLRRDPDRRHRRDQAFALARAAEPHDAAIGGHLRRINALVRCIAGELGLAPDEAERLGDDAMLHDVGKLHVPAALLAHDGPLDERERTIVARHTTLGEAFLRGRPGLARAATIARHHHERWDGRGQPDGRRGIDIPLAARITAAADLLDALATARPYKRAWSWDGAMDHVRGSAGGALDPGVVMAVIAADRAGRLRRDWAEAESALTESELGPGAGPVVAGRAA